ncbi:hypothetical protein M8542_22105 [Amycolatopsis sp. OK19-0408]|uniref:Uncharacterized protein n=1 Tax=Amycolatopsis iheyensis TaxID=2945988 RepID=A0A9X2NE19_9PSEU|nr:hypothetical protein [Amycolatopsis iheyensis]MCR6485526.1 hypothetical protein [Amycolatopsis iheyensis]
MYCLEAAIGTEAVLRRVAGPRPEARVVELGRGLSLLLMTDDFFDAVTDIGADALEGFWKAPRGFGRLLAAVSADGAVAYVEADFFGGSGSQCAQVWNRGEVVLGPLRLDVGERPAVGGSPISRALRELGVVRGGHFDEFEAIGLGRHRETDAWLPAGERP